MVTYNVCFRCFYLGGNYTEHRQELLLSEIPRWLDSYKFTHPECVSISFKIWWTDNIIEKKDGI